MDQALNELAELLEDLHLYHGVVEDGSVFATVEAMHRQAVQYLARVRSEAAKLQGQYDEAAETLLAYREGTSHEQ